MNMNFLCYFPCKGSLFDRAAVLFQKFNQGKLRTVRIDDKINHIHIFFQLAPPVILIKIQIPRRINRFRIRTLIRQELCNFGLYNNKIRILFSLS